MPGGDGTGPAGLGPMTGRAAGYCAGYPAPGFMNPVPGRGRGFGFGRGLGRGFRRGRGGFGGFSAGWGGYWGAPPYAGTAYPYPAAVAPYTPYGPAPTPREESDVLKSQAEYFEDALQGIKKRLAELEAKTEEE